MQDQRFTLSTTGQVVDGATPTQVQQNLRAHLKLPEMHISAMFSGKRTVIKKNIDLMTAQKYIKQFFTMGLILIKEPMDLSLETASKVEQVTPSLPVSKIEENSEFPQELTFEFTGNGSEYFKIWIVNIALTILTLGIYSAWAKVRNKQYFYGNTFLDGSSFEYTATPIQILKGRIVAAILLFIYFVGDALIVAPIQQAIFGLVMLSIFAVIFPMLVVKSLQFNACYSRYRNISFNFKGSYRGAFKYFILLPLASITIVLIPYIWQRKNMYFVENSFYGTERFTFTAHPKEYFPLLGIILAIIAVLSIFAWAVMTSSAGLSSIFILPLFYLIGVLFVRAYYKVHTHNVMYNNSIIKGHSLAGNYEFSSYLKLLFVNTFAILLTLGLFIPWAKVRTARYHAEHTQFIASKDLNTFVAEQGKRVNSLAEGLADVNDVFDVGVGI